MARGSESKQKVIDKIKEIYPDAFIYGKELRIPMEEDGMRVEIKVALTCAKTNVGGDGDSVESQGEVSAPVNAPAAAPSEQEKQNIADLMSRLGI
ncbi:MAG TPA: hypothetical protein DCL29_02015 [Eubacterium sp.]|nr:hypothetical protein [Eubacterium sp.]